jgi:hypothetical protein
LSPLLPSLRGFHNGLLVTSLVSLNIAGLGAVVYDVKLDPSDSKTVWGYIAGSGLGTVGALRRWDAYFQPADREAATGVVVDKLLVGASPRVVREAAPLRMALGSRARQVGQPGDMALI